MLPHRRGYGKSHLGHHFRDPEREVSDTHGRFLHPSPEIISSWSSIEVVITRRTRNPLAFRGPWVRIPPAPPSKKALCRKRQRAFLLGRLSTPVFSPHTPHRHTSSAPAGDILQQAHHILLLHRITASADDHALRSRKKFSAIFLSNMVHDT